ncbi:MAG TPA: hypothetical protein VGO79_01305 [Thermoanaerobaculia bacterium]
MANNETQPRMRAPLNHFLGGLKKTVSWARIRKAMEEVSPERARPRGGSALVVGAAVLLIARASPLAWAYVVKLRGLHTTTSLAAAGAAGVAALALLMLAIRSRPRATAAGLVGVGLVVALLAGNAAALLAAAGILAGTLLLGDLVARLLLGREPEEDLAASTTLAAGVVAAGLLVLALAEAGLLTPRVLAVLALALATARARRVPRLWRSSFRLPTPDSRLSSVEAAWLAFAAAVVLACWVGAQGPDLSWDALAYHLPEARDIAITGRLEAAPDLAPQSLLWHNHDAYLALAFLVRHEGVGGERVVSILQFAIGLAVFGAAIALARRLGAGSAAPLTVLALAAFPPAMLQLHAAYVDWPAALLVTAAAAQLAEKKTSGATGRSRLAGFLLGGAAVTKIFALFALPAMALLARRARLSGRTLAAACACAAVPLAPWLVWGQLHAGSVLAPYAASPGELLHRAATGHFFTTSPASGAARAAPGPLAAAAGLLRLPYDLAFHSSRFEGNGDGYDGILALLLLLGVAGWGGRGAGLFAAASLPFLIPWSLLYLPSIRFLLPVYPLYAVFTAEGLRRLTGRFASGPGSIAGWAVLAAAALFPVQVGSSGEEWRVALGQSTREDSLAARLPSWTLWRFVGPGDRLLFIGENDRFHCPARAAWRYEFRPAASAGDAAIWNRDLADLAITHVLWRKDRVPNLPAGFPADRLDEIGRRGDSFLYRLRRAGARDGGVQ